MKISVAKERRPHERRVAASPDTVKRLVGRDTRWWSRPAPAPAPPSPTRPMRGGRRHHRPRCRGGARRRRHRAQGAAAAARRRGRDRRAGLIKRGAVLIGMLPPLQHREDVEAYAKAGVTAFAMELVPRITRAQAMDVLSSQANLAGYKAVLDAADAFGRAFPMMMTAAGTIAPAARAGAWAPASPGCRRSPPRGGSARWSPRPMCDFAAKEQVESLGASFLDRRSRGDEGDGDGRRLCQGDGRGLRPPPARARHRGAEEDRHRDLHRADPRAQGAGADHARTWSPRCGPAR